MQRRHAALLTANHDFLVGEMPMDATLDAIRAKKILNWHDFDQLRTLRHQGRKALARYFLAVLPCRGPKAFQALLESLQEAQAQHLVDLLLQQAGALNLDQLFSEEGQKRGRGGKNGTTHPDTPSDTPSDTPLPRGPDPHEYAVRLSKNAKLIREFVDPAQVSALLAQNKVMTAREDDMVRHIHGKNKKWDLVMAVLLQRGERAYQAFMACLLQKGYSKVFHTIQETKTTLPASDDDDNTDISDDGNDDDIMDSDEEVKSEAAGRTSVADSLLREASAGGKVKADDTLLGGSRDLTNVDLKRSSQDEGHYGEEGKKDEGTTGRASESQRSKSFQSERKRSTVSGVLNPVMEED